jgi:DNA-binding MarR family transcriptional regulator
MSTFTILDAFATLRRELSLILAAQLKSTDFGHKQMVILYRLIQSPTSMGELATYCQSDPAATTRTVAALERSGFVKRVGDANDNRRSIIELTKKGKIKAAKANDIRREIGTRINQTLTADELVLMGELFNKIIKGLQDQKTQEE